MRLLPLLAATALALCAASAAAAPAHKAPAAAAAKPAGAAAAPRLNIPGFDARNPDSLVALLKAMQADGKVVKNDGGQVFLQVTAANVGFGGQYLGCTQGKACKVLVMFTALDKKTLTLTQINAYNRAQPFCRAMQTADNKPGVSYSTLVNQRMSAEETAEHMGAWRNCLTSFAQFAQDPDAMLAKAAAK